MGTYTDLNVSDARNSGWPKRGDPHGHGAPIVVSGRESRLQGEGGQGNRVSNWRKGDAEGVNSP